MLGTSDGTFCPLSKLWCKSPQTEFFEPERERFLYNVELRHCYRFNIEYLFDLCNAPTAESRSIISSCYTPSLIGL